MKKCWLHKWEAYVLFIEAPYIYFTSKDLSNIEQCEKCEMVRIKDVNDLVLINTKQGF